MKYPALDVRGVDCDLLLASADDFSPSAVDEHHDIVTIFFVDALRRERAARAIADAWPAATITARDVDDEDWARRSQESLTPITVGRITVTPPWFAPPSLSLDRHELRRGSAERHGGQALPSGREPLVLVIAPSMGFGTGHHATTRLCLAALQALDLTGSFVLDVGTGSGVLAIAGRALGAREAVGIDNDADAIQAAQENLAANPGIDHVRFLVGDLRTAALPMADVVTANLTGALLVQAAPLLRQALRAGGTLILSGLLSYERADVVSAFAGTATLAWDAEEQGWIGLAFNSRAQTEV